MLAASCIRLGTRAVDSGDGWCCACPTVAMLEQSRQVLLLYWSATRCVHAYACARRFGAVPPDPWLEQLAEASQQCMHRFSAWSLPDLATGLVTLGYRPSGQWWNRYARTDVPCVSPYRLLRCL